MVAVMTVPPGVDRSGNLLNSSTAYLKKNGTCTFNNCRQKKDKLRKTAGHKNLCKIKAHTHTHQCIHIHTQRKELKLNIHTLTQCIEPLTKRANTSHNTFIY